jgi:glycosyltransferase involved in cell wall biosynthesis
MLEDKGVPTLIAAHRLLSKQEPSVRLLLAGTPDPANPTSLSQEQITAWCKDRGIVWRGHVEDIRTIWADAHIAVLPSRREGLPISLMEAASCSRPLIATDVPGCREIARPNVNALLVPPDDPAALAKAIMQLAVDPALRCRLGAAGRDLVETEFSAQRVGAEIVALYDRVRRAFAK